MSDILNRRTFHMFQFQSNSQQMVLLDYRHTELNHHKIERSKNEKRKYLKRKWEIADSIVSCFYLKIKFKIQMHHIIHIRTSNGRILILYRINSRWNTVFYRNCMYCFYKESVIFILECSEHRSWPRTKYQAKWQSLTPVITIVD